MKKCFEGLAGKKLITTIIITLISFILCVLMNVRNDGNLRYKDIRLYYVFVAVLFFTYLVLYRINWNELRDKLKRCKIALKNKRIWKVILGTIIVIMADFAIACMVESLWANINYTNPYRGWLVFVALVLISTVALYRKYIWKYAHIYFFIVVMLLGSVNAITIPMPYLSWDDQIHYERTAHMSYGGAGTISEADFAAIEDGWRFFYYNGTGIIQKDVRQEWENLIQTKDVNTKVNTAKVVDCTYVAYAPASISLYIGRVLGLEFTTNFIIGKLTSLACYALFLSYSIKLLKGRGKVLVAVLGLIPTMLYMASSYAYDWWVYSLVILGYAIVIGELQRTGKVGTWEFIKAAAIMVVGMLPKPVYFPLIFPLMLMRKDKYSDSKKCRVITIGAMLILVTSFMIPLIISGRGSNDMRGGAGVDSAGQIVFILTNLVAYIKILFNFLWEYLSPDIAYEYLTNMAYLGFCGYYTICMLLLGVVTFLDNDETVTFGKAEILTKWGSFVGVLGSLVVAVTSLYISFTAVGAETIAGCQGRYILPVLFPFLFFVGEMGVRVPEKMREKLFVFSVNIMAGVYLLGCYTQCVNLY